MFICDHLHRHPALPISVSLQQQALRCEFGRLGSRLHPLRDVRPEGTSFLTQYPFEASNMISLAKKIVCDEVPPIPKYYSKELNDIVM